MRWRFAWLAVLWCAAAPAAAAIGFAALAAETPPATLSATGLFADMGAKRLAPGVVPYAVAAPLFSDHADKARGIALPPGTRARLVGDGLLVFPVGTVLVKSFGYPASAAGPAVTIETRLLVRRESGWVALPYVWDADGREAYLRRAGARVPVRFAAGGQVFSLGWQVPNVNQCKGCHAEGGALMPLGVKARNLVATGDLARLAALGLLLGTQAMPVRAPVPRVADVAAPVEARARAYLDANCGHCHRRQGSASNSGLFLDWEEQDPVAIGIGRRPVAAGRGSGGHSFAIDPGRPARSILLFRMESTEPGVMMPELGRTLPDPEGIALVRAWIAGLKP
ncbi:SO2930 family diheme c-type cytochrome [Thermaurantiacus sp.]